jgi:hypothetical protein
MSEPEYVDSTDLSIQHTITDTAEARSSYLYAPTQNFRDHSLPQEMVQAHISYQPASLDTDHLSSGPLAHGRHLLVFALHGCETIRRSVTHRGLTRVSYKFGVAIVSRGHSMSMNGHFSGPRTRYLWRKALVTVSKRQRMALRIL